MWEKPIIVTGTDEERERHGICCALCGQKYLIGEFPFCPHGPVTKLAEKRYFGFDAYVDDHIDEQPVEITSPGQRDRLMRKNGLEVRPREHINDLNHRRWKKGLPPLPR